MGVKSRLIGLSSAAVILTAVLSGCGDQSDTIKSLEAQNEALQSQINVLSTQADNMTVTEVTPDSSLYIVEGSGVPTFQTIDKMLKFPNKLTIDDSKDDVNNSNVRVGSMFQYTPSNNWQMKLDGATLNVGHPSSIWGSIKAITVADRVPEANMQAMLQGFFKGFPKTTISYRKVFIDDSVVGMIAKAEITVDKKPYIVNAGFMTRGDYGQLMLFSYKNTNAGVQQELVDLLISSGTFGSSKVKLE
jgi:hypothetical protein